ncbi:MBL fold metallo-hydrolase [Streptomyces chartreusis]
MTPLTYSTLVQDGILRAGDQRMPSGDPLVSSPLTSTLIVGGEAAAVLVDPPMTREQTRKVGDWIEHSGKQLAHIYITHGHGDQWFGADDLLRRFPTAQASAPPDAIAMMQHQATTGRALRWDKDFPGLIGDTPGVARPVPEEGLLLEGHVLKPVPNHHTDTDHTSVLHIPDLGLAVAGDAVYIYNNVHLYLSEGADGGFAAWLRALDTVEGLRPVAVIADHQDRSRPDTPDNIPQTRAYLNDVEQLLALHPPPTAFYQEMLVRHPDRLNPSPLWYGALTLLG